MTALGCLSACAMRAGPGQTPLVGDIAIRGNTAVKTSDIVGKLALTKSGFQFVFKVGDPVPFDPDLVRVDRLRVERIYQSYGYYSAKVIDILTKDDKGRINITFVVTEGEPTHVTKRDIGGIESLPPEVQKHVLRRLPLKEKDVFTEAEYDITKERLKDHLKDMGYWEAIVDGRIVLDPAKRTAEVTYSVAAGPRYKIRSVDVVASNDVSKDRIRAASGLRVDQYLTPDGLTVAQHRVQGLGVFSQTLVKPHDFDRTNSTAGVNIEVADAPFQTVDGGLGIEADQTRQLARLRGVYTHKNLGINLEQLVAGGSIGYAFLPTVWNFVGGTNGKSGVIADLQLRYIQPRVLLLPFDAHAALTYSKDLVPAFGFQRVGAETGVLVYVDAAPGLTIAPSIHYDFYFDTSTGTPQPTIPGQAPTSFATSGCGPDLSGKTTPTCSIAYVEARIAYDARDNPESARSGYYLALSVQYAIPVISEFNYLRLNPEGRVYVPIPYARDFTLAGRLNYGSLHQLGGRQPPGVARFFAGGANSVRATSAQQLGPREYVVLPNPNKKSSTAFVAGAPVPVGGDRLFEASAELRWRTPIRELTIAAFFDIGELALSENNPVPNTSGSFQFGPGIGFRYKTPIGPLRLDFSYRISRLDTNPVIVDTTNVKDPVASGVPTTVFDVNGNRNYAISTECRLASGQQSYQCFGDPRFQFFLTLGDPF